MVEIDFFTLIAQIINFLVLVLLLRHFLYRRIVKAIDEREKKIASQLEEAKQKKKEAEQEAESFRIQKQELQNKREELLAEVRGNVEAMRKDLMRKARDEVEESKAKWHEAIEREKEIFFSDLRRRLGEQICSIAKRALRDLANEELERQIINTFIKRLQGMSEYEKEAIKTFNRHQEIVIRSVFEIPGGLRQDIQNALKQKLGDEVKTQFQISPDLICGIEMDAYGTRITWSLDSYFASLEEDLSRAFEQSPVEVSGAKEG